MKKIISVILSLCFIAGCAAMCVSAEETEAAKGLVFTAESGIHANTYTCYVTVPAGTTVAALLGMTENPVGVGVTSGGTLLSDDAVLATGNTVSCGLAYTVVVMGDVNGDGKIALADVTMMLKLIAGWSTVAEPAPGLTDVNGDTKVNLSDITLLLKVIAGWNGVAFASEPVIPDNVTPGLSKTVKAYSGNDFSSNRSAVNLCHGEQIGFKYTVGEKERATSVSVVIPSWADDIGDISVSVYTWLGDYDTTVAAMPVYTERFTSVRDCSAVTLNTLDGAGQGLRSGDYLLLLHDGYQAKNGGARGIGVWKNDLPAVGSFEFFFKNINNETGTSSPVETYSFGIEATLKITEVR